MRLRTIDGSTIHVNWEGTNESTVFNPEGETTDKFGTRLLNNPKFKGRFELVAEKNTEPKETFLCDTCGLVMKSKAGLGSHKRKHKEIST